MYLPRLFPLALTLIGVCFWTGTLGWATGPQPPSQGDGEDQTPGVVGAQGSTDWATVRKAVNQGRPRTAIKALKPIIERAKQSQNYDALTRGIVWQSGLRGSLQPNPTASKISFLQAELKAAPAEVHASLEAFLAAWIWNYFQENRWRLAKRTSVAGPALDPAEDDLKTWDLNRILTEIDLRFQHSLESKELRRVAVTEYAELLDAGTLGPQYRPTLYDVIAELAIEFYSAGEHGASRPEEAWVLAAESPIFAPLDEFLAWEPGNPDDRSPILQGVRLYQELLRFHQEDADQTARMDWDLARYRFAWNHATENEKKTWYQKALRRFAKENADHPISTRALYQLAEQFQADEDRIEAHRLASDAVTQFPDSVGGKRCANLIKRIEAKSLDVETERVWADPATEISVTYRNLTEVHFRMISFDYDAFLASQTRHPEQFLRNQKGKWRTQPVVRAWSEALPPTVDYQPRTQQIKIPGDIPLGTYWLIASNDPTFNQQAKQISICEVWRSKLALVISQRGRDQKTEGFVIDAQSGNPIVGAEVQAWRRRNGATGAQRTQTKLTDEQGRFAIVLAGNRQPTKLIVRHGDDSLAGSESLYGSRPRQTQKPIQRTIFFTDRAIYRPGQTIHYKGICYVSDQEKNRYRTLNRRNVTIVFSDANGEEIERRNHRTNDYGSVSGSFTAPQNRLTGRMNLRIQEGPGGGCSVRVEEYKRPKFQVAIESPSQTSKLGDQVAVSGKATAYTGVAIDHAKVTYRVVRQARYSPSWYWRCWWMPITPTPPQEIAAGTTTTDAAGRFEVSFLAQPDLAVKKEGDPTFTFTVHADVVDGTGETRSSQSSLSLGYSAISATLSTRSWLTDEAPVELSIKVNGLHGEDANSSGIVRVHRLQEPEKVARPSLNGSARGRFGIRPGPSGNDVRESDPRYPDSWLLGEVVDEIRLTTGSDGLAKVKTKLEAGMYRAVAELTDDQGNKASAFGKLQVWDPDATQLKTKVPFLFAASQASVQPGQTWVAHWGSGYPSARVRVSVTHRGELIQSYWTDQEHTQGKIEVPIDESMRGGLTVETLMVRENRIHFHSQSVSVPWTNKELDIRWERFTSKLKPAQQTTWTATIKGKPGRAGAREDDRELAVAEMVATLYDASLETFAKHSFPSLAWGFRNNHDRSYYRFGNQVTHLRSLQSRWRLNLQEPTMTYWRLPQELLVGNPRRLMAPSSMAFGFAAGGPAEGAAMPRMSAQVSRGRAGDAFASDESVAKLDSESGELAADQAGAQQNDGDKSRVSTLALDQVTTRTNLNETAFFLPQLVSRPDGTITFSFTMPEALTQWRFLGFAHDQQLRSGRLSGTTVTAKDLMVQPNPPRFLREGDEIEFTAKIANQSPTRQTGIARLSFADARTGDPVDDRLGNRSNQRPFEVPAGESRSVSWKIKVPDGLDVLTYKVVGATDRLSDGEEAFIPVVSRRVLVSESLPLPIDGGQSKEFQLNKLIESEGSDSIDHQSLTVQMVSNPSWYAVMSLPYLMEYPHECSEQTFNRFYANTLARHIVTSDPKVGRVFAQWRATAALESPLSQNEDLKSVALAESPWLRDAKSESQARRDVGVLFDTNRLDHEMATALDRLTRMQKEDGSWPWFTGGRSNRYLTLYITTGFARLRHLGVEIDVAPAIASLNTLDDWAKQRYLQATRKKAPGEGKAIGQRDVSIDSLMSMYLYTRSFFLNDRPVQPEHREAFGFWKKAAAKTWLKLPSIQSQAQLAVALKRLGDLDTAKQIMTSIKERAVQTDGLGMYWQASQRWQWYQAPIESQAMIIEAFDEVMDDGQAVKDCKKWMLTQKQTRSWNTTKATADAIYALLLRGENLLASDALVKVSLGGQPVRPSNVQAGTGFYQERLVGPEIKPAMGAVRVTKTDAGIAWGSLHWQYLTDLKNVTPSEQAPLRLTKKLYVKKNTTKGPQLIPLEGPAAVGDELVVRVVLRTDRDLQYVHLRDHRGSGTEPVNVLSGYRFQDGLSYYESTRDTASHFFIDFLPQGDYVFEYSTRVQLKGNYQTGFAKVQCMYAPEFHAHSKSLPIEVK